MAVTYKLGKVENGEVVEALGEWMFKERPSKGDHLSLLFTGRTETYEVIGYTHDGFTPETVAGMPNFFDPDKRPPSMQVKLISTHYDFEND